MLSPRFHRQGLAPEALARVMQYGFETLGLNKLSGRFMEHNEASRKVLARLGFSPDPKEKEYFYKRGQKEEILTYSLTKEDYEKTL